MDWAGIERVQIAGLPRGGAYADAVRYGKLIFLAGLVGVDGDLKLAGVDARSQAQQIMDSLTLVLSHFDAGFDHVLKVTTYLTDMTDREAVAEVRQAHFGEVLPAATLIAVAGLVLPEFRVEMDFTLAVP